MDPFFRRGAPFLFGMLALAGSLPFLPPALAVENLFGAPLRPHGPSLHRVLFSSPSASSSRLSPAAIYREFSPAVVTVTGFNEEGKGELGAGSLITQRGDVLTNAHVIIDKETGEPFPHLFISYKPRHLSGDPLVDLRHRTPARLERYDARLDLALLKPLSPPPSSARISLAKAADVVPGQRVVAIGNPESGGLWSLTEGIISTRLENFEGVPGKDVFQSDVGMNRGNSGGPLLDSQGRMVGINTAIARKSADGLAITNVNFSINSDTAARWIEGSGGWPGAPTSGSSLLTGSRIPSSPKPTGDGSLSPPLSESPKTLSPVPSPPKTLPGLVTPPHPYRSQLILDKEMQDLEDLGRSMHEEILKKLGGKAVLPPN